MTTGCKLGTYRFLGQNENSREKLVKTEKVFN